MLRVSAILFVFQGMQGSGKHMHVYKCVGIFSRKIHIQHTFLLCPEAGDNEKDQRETIYANLKTWKKDDICTNINQNALVEVQERIKVD